MSDNHKSKPIYKKQLPGGIAAAIFQSEKDGRIRRSVNLQKAYLKNQEWHRMNLYIDHRDLPFAIAALQSSLEFLNDTPVSGFIADESSEDEQAATAASV